ncbi:MAG: acyl-ACP--UDP-N-acetylglucosamine O-acyltransferase [Candidatus Cloacimonadaceae bacterium]
MTFIHPTAILDPDVQIGEDCYIGPYCQIGPRVILGDRTRLASNVIIGKNTTLGTDNKIFAHAVLGTDPQDLKFGGEETYLVIGNFNTIREFATINRSNQTGEVTHVGDYNLLMEYVHIAHNCQIGNHVVISNAVNMAGHVHIADWANIGGLTAIHQFVHIGTYAFVGGASAVKKDIAPYTRGQGNPYRTVGINSIGLFRKGFSSETVAQIKQIYMLFYQSKLNTSQALQAAAKWEKLTPEQQIFVDFVKHCERGLSN